MDCLIYEKRQDIESGRDPELEAFLGRLSELESELTIGRFSTDTIEKAKKENKLWYLGL